MKLFLLAFLIAAFLPVALRSEEPVVEREDETAVSTNVYKQLKPFVLKDLSGKEVKSAEEFKGKMLLLFFFASWAQPCVDQVPALVELQKTRSGKDFSVVGISLDERAGKEVRQFAQKNKINFPILLADMLIVQDVGGISALPTLCLVDQSRMLIVKETSVTSKETLEDILKTVREHQKSK
jgi:peroxiredoxin